ncbi:MAG: rhodanese-like domain-containing protein [Deinococcales bacterium]
MQHIHQNAIPKNASIIDIRDDLERSLKPLRFPNIYPIALGELEDGNPTLPPDPLVVVCTNGRRSAYAAALLEALGAKEVYVLESGIGR